MIDRTCGLACWMAKEEKCKCSCGGVNHGILKGHAQIGANDVPVRKRRIGTTIYRLSNVVTVQPANQPADFYSTDKWKDYGWYAAEQLCRRYGMTGWLSVPNARNKQTPMAFFVRATKAAWPKWPETCNHGVRPYLVWVRDDVAMEEAPTPEPSGPEEQCSLV